MKAVQVVLDEALIRALDAQARERDQSRSELIRDALREQLKAMINARADEQVHAAYLKTPERLFEVRQRGELPQAWEEDNWASIWNEERSAARGSRRRTKKGRS